MPGDLALRVAEWFRAVRADLEGLVRIASVSAEGPDTPPMLPASSVSRRCSVRLGWRRNAWSLRGGRRCDLDTRRPGLPDLALRGEVPARSQ